MSVVLLSSKMEEKNQEKDLDFVKSPTYSEKYVLSNSQYFTHTPTGHEFSEKGPFTFIVQVGWFWFLGHMTDSRFLLQHPSDCISPSAWVAALPPGGLLWAADRGAAQATSPRPLWDRRQPRGCQSSNWWPPGCSGMNLNSFHFLCPSFTSRWATFAQPLPLACWVVVCVSASYLSDGWGHSRWN